MLDADLRCMVAWWVSAWERERECMMLSCLHCLLGFFDQCVLPCQPVAYTAPGWRIPCWYVTERMPPHTSNEHLCTTLHMRALSAAAVAQPRSGRRPRAHSLAARSQLCAPMNVSWRCADAVQQPVRSYISMCTLCLALVRKQQAIATHTNPQRRATVIPVHSGQHDGGGCVAIGTQLTTAHPTDTLVVVAAAIYNLTTNKQYAAAAARAVFA